MFVLLVVASCWMLFQKNPYQQHVFLTSANRASAVVYKGAGEVTSYFNLRSINSDLQERNATLEMEVINLKRQIGEYKKEHDMTVVQTKRYSEILDKRGAQGSLMGIDPECIKNIFEHIHEESVRQQIDVINK